MYKHIAVAYDESLEAGHALAAAIQLTKALAGDLQTITVMEKLPAYTAFATGADASLVSILEDDCLKYHDQLQAAVRAAGTREGIEIVTHLIDGEEVDSIVRFVCEHKIDLLVIGLHHRSDRVSRLWSSVYSIAQNVTCSVLGVH